MPALNRPARRILEVLITEHGLVELYATLASIYQERLTRYGGAAYEPILRSHALALEMLEDAAGIREDLVTAWAAAGRSAEEAAESARKWGL